MGLIPRCTKWAIPMVTSSTLTILAAINWVTLEQRVARGLAAPLAGCRVSPLLSLIPPPKAAQKKRDLKSYKIGYYSKKSYVEQFTHKLCQTT